MNWSSMIVFLFVAGLIVAVAVILSPLAIKSGRYALSTVFPLLLASLCLLSLAGAFAEPDKDSDAAGEAKKPAAEQPLKLPEGWPEGHPVPIVRTNCMRCHLNAGRELTLAVHDFAHSVHDLNEMSCQDCHGGDTENDALAHDEAAGFIGTKLSAHLENCANCHPGAAEVLAEGPHHWDFSERINLNYPMCLDCHGNHDVGNPPSDFQLKSFICEDCHENFEEDYPAVASVVTQNDKLWDTMKKVRAARMEESEPVPAEFQDEVVAVRNETMQAVHGLSDVTEESAKELNTRAETLRRQLDKWLSKVEDMNQVGAEKGAGSK